MMTKEEQYKSKFPMTVVVTEDMLNSRGGTSSCTGANTLRKGLDNLGDSIYPVSWGVNDGFQPIDEDLEVLVGSFNSEGMKVNMMEIKKSDCPMEVTFKIIEE